MRASRTYRMALPVALVLSWLGRESPAQPRGAIRLPAVRPPMAEAPAAQVRARNRAGKVGLHIARNKPVTFTRILNDGAGYRWDIQQYGSIGQGTNGAYSGGLCLYVGGSRLIFGGSGWSNAAGDEVEMGPMTRNNVRVSRRIKVYRDRGLARWLDIFENPTSQEVTVSVRIWSDMITTVRRTVTNSGKAGFTSEDHAFVTVVGVNSAPALMHYVCSPKSKLRPRVTVQSDDINVYYTFKVPAGDARVLCYFEAQNRSADVLIKQMKAMRLGELLRDLPPSVKKRLLNMPSRSGYGGVDLERSESNDLVYNTHGDPIFGTITNESFRLETLFGPMKLPAAQVIGLASAGGGDRQFRVLLSGGQIIAGRLADDAKVELKLPAGGTLRVPFAAVRQCAFRISKDKPDEAGFSGPLLILRTGDRLAFDPAGAGLKFRTRHGVVGLSPRDLLTVSLDQEANGVHRVTFLNGSRLGGFLEPNRVALTLKVGAKVTVARNLIAELQFAEEDKPDPTLDAVLLSNGDELFGRLAEERLTVTTRYGKVGFGPESIQEMSISRTHLGRVSFKLWDGSVLRGQYGRQTLAFRIRPGPALDIDMAQCLRVHRNQALPPKDVRESLERLVGQLGAESYKDRQAATTALSKMGKGIVPMLRKHLAATDPEVRQRVEDIIERLGGKR